MLLGIVSNIPTENPILSPTFLHIISLTFILLEILLPLKQQQSIIYSSSDRLTKGLKIKPLAPINSPFVGEHKVLYLVYLFSITKNIFS